MLAVTEGDQGEAVLDAGLKVSGAEAGVVGIELRRDHRGVAVNTVDEEDAVAGGVGDGVPADAVMVGAQVGGGGQLRLRHELDLAGRIVAQVDDAVADGTEGDLMMGTDTE